VDCEIFVTVPATTANLGPGFDCLGLALGLYNHVTGRTTDGGLEVTIAGEGGAGYDPLPTDARNLVVRAAEQLFAEVGRRPAGLAIHQENHIPTGSGLGSSAAAVVAGLLLANELVDRQMGREEVLALAAEIEGHPDNVTPALYGGLTLINAGDSHLHVEPIAVPDMQVVVVLPDFQLATAEARAALPRQVPLADAIFNAGRLALLIRALEVGDYVKLSLATQDRLHQPYRLPLIPGMTQAFAAARSAGAAAVTLSGAGPSLIALAPDGHDAIAQAARQAFQAHGLSSRTWTLSVDRQGSTASTR
jgi:homoserine kinase